MVANIASLAATFAMGGDLGWLLWPYWIQSVVIGWYARQRMLALRDFSTDGFTTGRGTDRRQVPETDAGKRSTADFFAFHYGAFHAGYLVYLCAEHWPGSWLDLAVLLGCGLSFVVAQRQTFAEQLAHDARGRPNLGRMMFLPYIRVVPMHLLIASAASLGGTGAMLLFTALKTAGDLLLDRLDRRPLADAVAAAGGR